MKKTPVIKILSLLTALLLFCSCGAKNKVKPYQNVLDSLSASLSSVYCVNGKQLSAKEFCSFCSEAQFAFMDIDQANEAQRALAEYVLKLNCLDKIEQAEQNEGSGNLISNIVISVTEESKLSKKELEAFKAKFKNGYDASGITQAYNLTLGFAFETQINGFTKEIKNFYVLCENGGWKAFYEGVPGSINELGTESQKEFYSYAKRKNYSDKDVIVLLEGLSKTSKWSDKEFESYAAATTQAASQPFVMPKE